VKKRRHNPCVLTSRPHHPPLQTVESAMHRRVFRTITVFLVSRRIIHYKKANYPLREFSILLLDR